MPRRASTAAPASSRRIPLRAAPLRRGDLDQVRRAVGADAVARPGQDAECLAGLQPQLLHRAVGSHFEPHLSGQHIQSFVLALVVLEREALSRLQMQDLAGIAIVLGEDQLVPPGFWYPSHVRARKILSTSLWS